MAKYSFASPGKINLRLEVLRRRPDGYHDIRNLMVCVSLSDDVHMNIVEKGLLVTCDDIAVPDNEDNIVYKALKEILAYSSRNVGVEVHINKRIPVAAGMGGGSSNAATVIMGLNELLKLKLSKEKLMKIGLKIGADVPFFIFESPALAEGVGEQLRKIKTIPKLYLLIVNPGIAVSTKWAYRNVPSEVLYEKKDADVPDVYRTKKDVTKIMHNDLERITLREYPVIAEIKEQLVKLGAMASLMTGSGPSVFGVFADKNKLIQAHEKLGKKAKSNWRIFMTESVAA